MFKHLLIPTDGSEISQAAVRKGVELAQDLGARVTFVTASWPFDVLSLDPLVAVPVETQYLEAAERAARNRLQAASDYAAARGVQARSAHIYAEPWRAIVETAQENGCDLIFMASHGRKGVAAMVLGSTTVKVLAHSKIPVLAWR
jgi:nucleotide-binding universal stress UspA family protein